MTFQNLFQQTNIGQIIERLFRVCINLYMYGVPGSRKQKWRMHKHVTSLSLSSDLACITNEENVKLQKNWIPPKLAIFVHNILYS